MKKPPLPKHFKRFFLNEDEGSAYIMINAELEETYSKNGKTYLDARVEIKDCNRQCEIDFSVYGSKEGLYQERLTKLDNMISALTELLDFMVANPPNPPKSGEDEDHD